MIRLGLSSSSLITLGVSEVVAAAKEAKLDGIEWAGDIHVGDDPASAELVMMATLRAGLTVASYSSLFRAGSEDPGGKRFEALLRTATSLQSPVLRIFACDRPRSDGVKLWRARFIDQLRKLGDRASKRGITLCISMGRRTCVRDYDDARLVALEVGHPFVRLAWEELPGAASEEATAALEADADMACLLIARRYDENGRALPLAADCAAWQRRLGAFKRAETDPKMSRFAIIGAIRRDSGVARSLEEDAQVLRSALTSA